jgi:hypothetical protein
MLAEISTRSLNFVIISLFILGLHNLVIFAMRRKDRSSLYFGVYCLLLSINAWTSSPYPPAIFPGISALLFRKIKGGNVPYVRTASWDGSAFASGAYIVRVSAGDKRLVKKIVLAK